jgi:hypothetical protein
MARRPYRWGGSGGGRILLARSGGLKCLASTEIDGKEVRYRGDPGIGLWRRLEIGILLLLPIQNEF